MKEIPLNSDQDKAFARIQQFIQNGRERAFILKGAAGTGKTTLLSHLKKWLKEEKLANIYLSTTGRAAQVLAEKTGSTTSTIHSHLYVLDKIDSPTKTSQDPWVDQNGQLILVFGLKTETGNDTPPKVIVIDEASMISAVKTQQNQATYFGSGNLLKDLIEANPTSKFIFVGDPYQLPPVENNQSLKSVALSETLLQNIFKLSAASYELTQIMRQDSESAIITIAQSLRQQIDNLQNNEPIYFPMTASDNVVTFESEAKLFAYYKKVFNEYGTNLTKFIAHSNGEVHGANKYIRLMLRPRDKLGFIGKGEPLLVTQNCGPLMWLNGDIIETVVPAKYDRGYTIGLDFYRSTFKRISTGDVQNYRLINNLLFSKDPNLTNADFKILLIDFDKRMRNRNIKRNSKVYLEELGKDPYVNALRCKFGYAVSCHKAQGGEWDHVFLKFDPKYLFMKPKEYVLRWLYTAVTRSSKNLYLVGGGYIKESDR